MSASFLALLPKSARAALPAIQAGMRQGLSSRQITAAIQESGIRISRGRSVLPTMRALRDLERQGANVKFVSPANTINTRRLPPAITDQRRRFSYRVRIEGDGPLGRQVRHLNIATDDATWSRGMIEDKARDFAEGTGDSGQLSNVEVFLEHGQQRASLMDFAETPRGFISTGLR